VHLIPLSQITRNPGQPRETFPKEHIERLADSIRQRGLIQAITVRRDAPDRYTIVAGECRFRAHQLLGASEIRAEIVEISDGEMQLRAIVENLQRHDMNPIEEANAFRSLMDQGYDIARIVKELGLKSTALVMQRMQLLELTPQIQQLVASGQLASTMAWGVSLVPQHRQRELLRAIMSGKLRTSEQVKHAGIALRDADLQLDAFGELPKASPADLETISRLERKISLVVDMVLSGFKEGECVAAQRVAPDRLVTMADKLVLVRKHVLQMEHDLRRVATTTDLLSDRGNNDAIVATTADLRDRGKNAAKNSIHPTALGLADRQRGKGHRKQNVAHKLPRPRSHSRVGAS